MLKDVAGALSDAAHAEILDRAADQGGEVRLSGLHPLADPMVHPDLDVDGLAESAENLGVAVIDDTVEPPRRQVPSGFSADPVRQYLNQASQYELLDARDEADLAKRFQAGLEADRLLTGGQDLDARHRARLGRLRADGRRAKERMINANLRLVAPTAKKYIGDDYPMSEALQDGNLGLIRAVEKFDHTKGYKFSTYAVWWIRQSIQRGLSSRARTVRVPSNIWEEAARIRKAEARLRVTLEREPTPDETAAEAGLTADRVRDVKDWLRPTSSLDRPVGEDGDLSLGDLLPDVGAPGPDVNVEVADIRARLVRMLRPLPERERTIVELRYGLRDGESRSFAEIGRMIGLHRERVRQIEKSALEKLRDPATAEGLAEVFDALAA